MGVAFNKEYYAYTYNLAPKHFSIKNEKNTENNDINNKEETSTKNDKPLAYAEQAELETKYRIVTNESKSGSCEHCNSIADMSERGFSGSNKELWEKVTGIINMKRKESKLSPITLFDKEGVPANSSSLKNLVHWNCKCELVEIKNAEYGIRYILFKKGELPSGKMIEEDNLKMEEFISIFKDSSDKEIELFFNKSYYDMSNKKGPAQEVFPNRVFLEYIAERILNKIHDNPKGWNSLDIESQKHLKKIFMYAIKDNPKWFINKIYGYKISNAIINNKNDKLKKFEEEHPLVFDFLLEKAMDDFINGRKLDLALSAILEFSFIDKPDIRKKILGYLGTDKNKIEELSKNNPVLFDRISDNYLRDKSSFEKKYKSYTAQDKLIIRCKFKKDIANSSTNEKLIDSIGKMINKGKKKSDLSRQDFEVFFTTNPSLSSALAEACIDNIFENRSLDDFSQKFLSYYMSSGKNLSSLISRVEKEYKAGNSIAFDKLPKEFYNFIYEPSLDSMLNPAEWKKLKPAEQESLKKLIEQRIKNSTDEEFEKLMLKLCKEATWSSYDKCSNVEDYKLITGLFSGRIKNFFENEANRKKYVTVDPTTGLATMTDANLYKDFQDPITYQGVTYPHAGLDYHYNNSTGTMFHPVFAIEGERYIEWKINLAVQVK